MPLALALALIAALQSTLANLWQVRGVAPDLLLVSAVSCGMNLGLSNGAIAGFVIGFVQGTLQGANPGSYIVSRCLAGALGGVLQQAVSRENPVAIPICVSGISFVTETVFFLMAPSFPTGSITLRAMQDWLRATMILCAVSAIIAPLLHFPLTTIVRRARSR